MKSPTSPLIMVWSEDTLMEWAYADDENLVLALLDVRVGPPPQPETLHIEEWDSYEEAEAHYGREALSWWWVDGPEEIEVLPSATLLEHPDPDVVKRAISSVPLAEVLEHPDRKVREMGIAHLREVRKVGNSPAGV